MKKQWRKLTASSFVFYYIYPILFSVLYVVIKLSFFHCKYEDHFIIILPLFMFYYSLYNVIYYIIFFYMMFFKNACNKQWFIIIESLIFQMALFCYDNIIKTNDQLYFQLSLFALQLIVVTIIMFIIVIVKQILKKCANKINMES